MAKKKEMKLTDEKVIIAKPKKDFKEFPLKKATKIGDVLRPIGYKISLTKEGYEFYKQKKN